MANCDVVDDLEHACAHALTALKGVRTTHAIRRYPIVGSRWEALATVMDTLGPRRDGVSFAALTSWQVAWSHDVAQAPSGKVALRDVTMSLRLEITFPVWHACKTAPSALVTRWRRFANALQHHEREHVENVVRGVAELSAMFDATKAAHSEAALRLSVALRAHQILEAVRLRDVHLDGVTDHGRALVGVEGAA